MEDRQINEQDQQVSFSSSTSESLFCSDETYEHDNNIITENTLFSRSTEHALFSEDDELSTLLAREAEHVMITRVYGQIQEPDKFMSEVRREAVEWILHATSHHCFSAVTALLAVDYLDRFIFRFDGFRRDQKPWMTELTAVACLSLAAKFEEIHVPLLLDLQVEGTSKFMFEAKTIQRMEVLVLSRLQWRMNPVTSLSYLHHVCKRLGLKGRVCFEFLRRCELTLLSVVSDCRFTLHLPSTMAAATALHVVNGVVNPDVALEHERLLVGFLKIDEDNVERCRRFVHEAVSVPSHGRLRSNKRKLRGVTPGSPNGVIDASFSSDGSTDSSVTMPSSSPFSSSSVTSSPEPSSKKSKNTTTTYNNTV